MNLFVVALGRDEDEGDSGIFLFFVERVLEENKWTEACGGFHPRLLAELLKNLEYRKLRFSIDTQYFQPSLP